MNNKNKGVLFALSAAILSGFAIFYSKLAIIKIDPLILTTSRNFYVGLLFLGLIIISKKFHEIKLLTLNQFIKLIVIGFIGGAVPFFLFFNGLKIVNSQTANFIHKTLFIWVSILSIIFLKERFNLKFFISFLLILLASLFFTKIPISFGRGEIMIFGATLLWSIENIITKKILDKISTEIVGFFRMGAGSIFLLSTAFITGKGNLFFSLDVSKLWIIFIGGTVLFLYVFFWFKALKFAPASLVTMILTFSVVVGNILSNLFIGIKIIPNDLYSSLFITIAVSIILLHGQTRTSALR